MKKATVVILVMGEVGAGKSSFINAAAGLPLTKHHKNSMKSVVFVDTPGFNHPSKPDRVILKEIVDWLKKRDHGDAQFGGIIYLHDLAQARQRKRAMTPTKLSNPEPARRVILATVKGDDVTPSQADHREKQLKDDIWQEAVKGGSQMCRFMNTRGSAWSIVDMILERDTIELSCIQKELEGICSELPNSKRISTSPLFGFLFSFRS